MKEFVFSYKENNGPHAGKHIARFDGKTEDEAFQKLLELYPAAVKLEAFEVDEKLAKILDAVKQLQNKDELNDIAANAEMHTKADAIQQFKVNAENFRRQKIADNIEAKTLKDGKMSQEEWNMLRSSMSPEEQKAMYDEFIADADKNHKDKAAATLEKKFINYIFGIKQKGQWQSDNFTVRDLAQLFGVSHVYVLKLQKLALTKLVNNIAKLRHYPFRITTAEEAIALLLADNIANPADLKLKAKVHGDMSLEDALKKYVKMEKAHKNAMAAKKKADDKAYRAAMKEFQQLEKETNKLRDKLGLPRMYNRFYKFFKGQKIDN